MPRLFRAMVRLVCNFWWQIPGSCRILITYITSSTNFKKSFIKFNLDRKNILLVNNKIHNLEYLVKKNMSFSLFENLFYFYLSKFVYYCSFIKKYFYFLKRYIKFF